MSSPSNVTSLTGGTAGRPTMSEITVETSVVALCSSVWNGPWKTKKSTSRMTIPYWSSDDQCGVGLAIHEARDDARSVERRDRQQVEDPEHDVHVHGVDDHLLGRARVGRVREDRPEQDREQEVRDRSCDADERHAALGPEPQVARVDGHRLRPAEEEASRPVARDEHQAAERLEVHDRVQGEAAEQLRGRVAEPVGDPAVRELVQRQRADEDRQHDQEDLELRVRHESC